ncbi:MAG: metallophosphoesterase, partial [Acidobacteria bacterium]|nr:metallophosphoesterase [Acidobacteriota bacterium]
MALCEFKVFRRAIVLPLALLLVFSLLSPGCKKEGKEFTFAFLTDIHIQPEKQAAEGMGQAIVEVNKLKPDFVITGGDQIMDALSQSAERAGAQYGLFAETSAGFN